jgi:membrane protease YdiL (CAAX protease family)
MTPGSLFRRWPLTGFFVLAYGISWGGILVVLARTGFDLVRLRPMDTGLIFVLMLLGPGIAGIACTALLDGRAGLRDLRFRLARWRVRGRWYAVALFTMPVVLLAVLLPLSAVDPAFSPRFQWPLLALGLVAGSFEEIGWTGFATPHLLARQRSFVAGLVLGLAWALWHGLVDFRQNFHALGMAWLLEFALLYMAALTGYRLLMTWVYLHTRSLLLAMLMHASYTGWLLALYPATSFGQGLAWQGAFAAMLWLFVALAYARRVRNALKPARARTVTLAAPPGGR